MIIRFKEITTLKVYPIEGREGEPEWNRFQPDVDIEIDVIEVRDDKVDFRFVGEFLEAHNVSLDQFDIVEGALMRPFDGTLDD